MKIIGLIGGMSWVSSLEYYRMINETVKERLGGIHSAKCILYSVDIAEVIESQEKKGWGDFTNQLIDIAHKLENAGAGLILICTNTVHRVYDEMQAKTTLPILHIADATGEKIKENGISKVGLLGTRLTMKEDFYKKRLKDGFGIDTVVPRAEEIELIHGIILNELVVDKITESSKEKFRNIIDGLIENGAEGIILGCTEIPLLVKQEDVKVPIFDTATIHAKTAVDFALRGNG
jgi:aspartate racemase